MSKDTQSADGQELSARIVEDLDQLKSGSSSDVKMTILIVDSSQDMAEILSTFFRMHGHEVICVETGIEAVEAASERTFDMVYICSALPDIPPIKLIGVLKAMLRLAAATFVATTGDAKPIYRIAAIAAGFDYFFIKPVDIKDLYTPITDRATRYANGINGNAFPDT